MNGERARITPLVSDGIKERVNQEILRFSINLGGLQKKGT